MSIFDFFGIGKKKEETTASQWNAKVSPDTKKSVPITSTTGAGSVAEIATTPKIDFFSQKTTTPIKTPVASGQGSVNTEIPKIDFFGKKSDEPATKEYEGLLGSITQQATKYLTSLGYQTAEHFLRKISPTEDMVSMVPDKFKGVVREHFEQKAPDVLYNKLQQKDTELMKNPEFASKFDKGIVTAIKEKDRKTLSNPEFRGEVVGQGLGGSLPSLAVSLATKNPTIATMAFFPQMEQEAYEDINNDKDTSGLPEGVKEGYAMTVGALNTAIEGIGLNFLTKPFLKAMKKEIIGEVLKSPLKAGIKSLAQSMGSEGLEEVMQQLTSDVMAKIFGSQRNLPSLEQLGNIFASASFGVGPISIAGGVTEFNTQSNINKDIMAKPVEKGERFQEQLPQEIEVYKGKQEGGKKKFDMDYYALDEKSAEQYGNVEKTKITVNKTADFTNPNEELSNILHEKSGFSKEAIDRALKQEDSIFSPIYEMLEVPAVKEALRENGYDSIKFKDFGNKKTGFARHDTIALIDKEKQSPLHEEAKKYKSAEEFADKNTNLYHGTNDNFDTYDIKKAMNKGEQGENLRGLGFYMTPNKGTASQYGKNIMKFTADIKNPLDLSKFKTEKALADYLDISEDITTTRNGIPTVLGKYAQQLSSSAEELGHDAIIANNGQEIVILNTDILKTEKQLKKIREEANTSKFQQKSSTTDQATAEDIAKAKALLPEATYKTVEQIVNPKTGLPAYGSYLDGMITFAKTLTKTTAYHEVFHGYFDMFTDQKTQREILEIVKKNENIKTDLDAEERLAEKFAENAVNLEQGKDTKGNYKILDFLDQLRAKVKEVFGQGDKIKQLYEDIMEGKRPPMEQYKINISKMNREALYQEKDKLDEIVKNIDITDDNFAEKINETIDKIDSVYENLQKDSRKAEKWDNMSISDMQSYKYSTKYKRLDSVNRDLFDRMFYEKLFPETDISGQNMNFKKTTEQYTIEERKKRSIIGGAMISNRNKGKDISEIINYNKLGEVRKNDGEGQKEGKRYSQEVYEKNIGNNDKENKKILSSANKSFGEKLGGFFGGIGSMVETATKSGREILEDIHPQLVGEYYMYSDFVNTTTQKFLTEIKDDIIAMNKMEKKSPTDFMKFFFAWGNGDIETQTEIGNKYGIDVTKIRELNGQIREIAIEQGMDVPRREGHNPMGLKNKEKFDEIIKKRGIGNYIEEFMNLSDPVKNRKLVESIYDMLDKLNKKTWNLKNITDVEVTLDKISEGFTETNKEVIVGIKKFIRDSIERGDIEGDFGKTVWKTIEFMKDSVAMVLEGDIEGSDAKIFNYIKGISQEWIGGLEYGSMKRREIDFYDKELLSVYHKPQDILVRYIAGMIESVGKARYLGGVADDVSLLVNDYATRKAIELNLSDKDREKLVDVLTARFSYNKYGKTPGERRKLEAVKIIKNLGYVTGMSSLASTLSQLEDVSVSIIENGVSQAMKQYGKSIAGNSKISAIKMGYGGIGPEFAKSGITKADVSLFLKINGFQWMDMRGKEAFLNSLYQNMVNTTQGENTKKQDKLRSDMEKFLGYFGKETIDKTMGVLKEGKINDIVNAYLRLKLSGVQPADQMDMPIGLMKNPQLAYLRQFKTFLTKRLQYMYRNGIMEIVRAKGFKAKAKATYRFSRMLMIMMICGGITDELKDFILFRKSSSILWRLIEGEDITPAMLDKLTTNLLKFIGIGKYNIYQAKTEGIDNVIQGIFFSMPALQIPANMIMDLTDIVTDGFDIEKIRTLNNVPTVGKHMYRGFGRGYASQQKTLQKERKGAGKRSGGF